MQVRNIQASDYREVMRVINDWWGGRQMADKLPKLFFEHFQDTSWLVESDEEMVAFLIGFRSQSVPNEAYIHFIGVHPDFRKHGLAQDLYHRFFADVQARGCDTVRCVTSPVNKGSIAYHTRMGFQIEPSDGEADSLVRFVRAL